METQLNRGRPGRRHAAAGHPAQAEDELLAGVDDRLGAAPGARVEADQQWLDRALGHADAQVGQLAVGECRRLLLIGLKEDQPAAGDLWRKEGGDRQAEGHRDLLERADARRGAPVLNQAERVDGQATRFGQRSN